MSYRLKEIVFQARCNEPGCPFRVEFAVKENIMGATEADIDAEAWRFARNLAFIKHDSLYGRKHALVRPEIRKMSAKYEQIGEDMIDALTPPASPPTRTFGKGEWIIRKGESATTVCEVIRGSAVNEKRQEVVYEAGSTFGAAALFQQKNRMADIVAGEEGTVIGFYNMRELVKTNPPKARELYNAAMEDMFNVITHLEECNALLEKKVGRLKAVKRRKGPSKAASSTKKQAKKRPSPKKKPSRAAGTGKKPKK
jgi:CRP-like cAMP-binding protein